MFPAAKQTSEDAPNMNVSAIHRLSREQNCAPQQDESHAILPHLNRDFFSNFERRGSIPQVWRKLRQVSSVSIVVVFTRYIYSQRREQW